MSDGVSVPGLVSIVVVGHNNWPELEMAIASALGQTYPHIEVVVVDNNSTDETSAEVPDRFGQKIRYVRQSDTSHGGGYNCGIAISTGAFVHLLDGDDVLSPTMIEKQVAMLDQDKSLDAVYGDTRPFFDEPGIEPELRSEKYFLKDYDDFLAALIRVDDNGYIIPSSILFRRSMLDRIGPFIASQGPWENIWGHTDREYLLRAANAGCRFRYSPRALVFYRQHHRQMSQDVERVARGYDVLLEQMEQTITREPYHGMLRSVRARRLFSRAMSVKSGRTKALAELRRARTSDSQTISLLRYALGVIVIFFPGGPWVYSLQRHLRSGRLCRRMLEGAN